LLAPPGQSGEESPVLDEKRRVIALLDGGALVLAARSNILCGRNWQG
jgi:hypothetical protein